MPENNNPLNKNDNSIQMPPPAGSNDLVTPSFAVMPKPPGETMPTSEMPTMADIRAVTPTGPNGPGFMHKKSTYLVIGILVLLILGGLAYFLLAPNLNKTVTPANATKLPKIFLQQYFKVEICQSMDKCGDDADPDNDGLSNYLEFTEQTDPTNADTDGDGLADGDELNIYLTLPTEKFTDKRPDAIKNSYSDSVQIKSNYDPLTPGLRMSEVRLKQIATATTEFKLHEPTIATLAAPAVPASSTVTVMIVNNKFDKAEVTVKVGDTVVWLNKDSKPHQIMHDFVVPDTEPLLSSGSLGTNQTYSAVFTKVGTYSYYDELNRTSKGKVIVTE